MEEKNKKNKRNKKRYVGIITAILIVAVATVTVARSPQISGIFNPENFEQFNNNEDDASDILAGNGRKSDLADQNKDGKAQEENQQQAVEMMQKRQLTKKDNNSDDSIAKVDTTNTKNPQNNKNQDVAEETPAKDGDNSDNTPGTSDDPGNGDSGTEDSGREDPGNDDPGTEDPGNNDSTTEDPGNDNPTTEDPGNDNPTTEDPGNDNPSTENPGNDDNNPTTEENWEDNQLKPKDPIVDEMGTLIRLDIEVPDDWTFYPGASFSTDGVTVEAVYKNNGKEVKKELSYGKNGYSVSLKTSTIGYNQIAVFSYKNVSVKTTYNVLRGSAVIYYHVRIAGDAYVYTAQFPGTLEDEQGSAYENIKLRPKNGIIDFSKYHKVLTAWLGNEEVKKELTKGDTATADDSGSIKASNNYKNIVFLQEDDDGYLTNMLTGFDYVNSGKQESGKTYIYYPFDKDTGNVKIVVDIVDSVPDGFKIKREVTGDSIAEMTGEQVLKQYTGTDTTVEVPMGVTKVDLEGKQGNYQTIGKIVLPESVDSINVKNIYTYMPMLEEYEVTGTSNYKVVDGVLYSKDGKTLLSVPAGKTSIKKWSSDVTTIAEGAFEGCNIEDLTLPSTVTTLEKGCFSGYKGNVIRFASKSTPTIEGNIGYTGKLLVMDSDYDLVYKKWMLAFKEEGKDIHFGAMKQDGTEISEKTGKYRYKSENDILVLAEDTSVFAAAPIENIKYYSIPKGMTTIAEGAFLTSETIKEIQASSSVEQLNEGAMLLPSSVKQIEFDAELVTPDEKVFGNPTDGANVPDIKICVDADQKENYISVWSEKIDATYGTGTAQSLFSVSNKHIIYRDNAKYERMKIQNKDVYRLLKVYGSECTSFQVPNRTVEIASDAFSDLTNLEILYISGDVMTVESGAFSKNTKLETLAYEGENIDAILTDTDIASDTRVYCEDNTYQKFLYEEGVLYGQYEDGSYELMNIPTDYSGGIEVEAETTVLGEEAFAGCTKIDSIILQNKVKKIEKRCFADFKDASEVGMHKFDFTDLTELESIGDFAFERCNAKMITMPEQKVQYGKGLFYGCDEAEQITIPNITEIPDQMFYGCSLLQTINIDWSEVTGIGEESFAYCSVFAANIDQTKNILKLSKVQTIGKRAFASCIGIRAFLLSEDLTKLEEEAFVDCTLLEEITLQGKVEVISRYCFSGCTNLQKVNFSEQQEKTLRIIGLEAFSGDYTLERMDLSNCSSLEKIGNRAFATCTNLSVVEFPTCLEEIPEECFDKCTTLSILRLSGETPVPLGTKIFGGELPEDMHIWVKNNSLDAYFEEYQPILDSEYGEGTTEKILDYNNDKVEVVGGITYEITEEGRTLVKAAKTVSGECTVLSGTVRILDEAFKDCTHLTTIAFLYGSSIAIGDRAFEGCTSLTTAKLYGSIPEWGEDTFKGCDNLDTVTIGENIESDIPRIGTRAFKDCSKLGSGTGRLTLLGKIKIYGEECFANCTELTGIYIVTAPTTADRPKQSTYWLEEIEDRAFAGCKKLKAFLVSTYVHLNKIGAYAFTDCDSITGPSVPASVTSIGEGCFSECDNLKYVSFYGGLKEYPKYAFRNSPKLQRTGGTAAAKTTLQKIGEGAYEGCQSLVISSSWSLEMYTNLQEIGDNAFRNCKSLTYLQTSSTVKSIGNHAFDGCNNASYLYLRSTTPPTFGAMNLSTMSSNFCILVPDSKEENDYIYRAYYKVFVGILGEEKTQEILQSVSDGASGRVDMSKDADTQKAEDKKKVEEKTTEKKTTEGKTNREKTTEKSSSEATTEKAIEATTEKSSPETMTEKATEATTEKSSTEQEVTE